MTQILSGALIGTSVTSDSLIRLKAVLLPAVLICCGFVAINIVLAFLLHKKLSHILKMSDAEAFTDSAASPEACGVAGGEIPNVNVVVNHAEKDVGVLFII